MREGRGRKKKKKKKTPEANLRCRSGRRDGSLTGSNPKVQGNPQRLGKLRRVRMRRGRAFQGTLEKRPERHLSGRGTSVGVA